MTATVILIAVALVLVWLAFKSKRTFDKADDREIKTSRTVFPPKGKKDWYGH